MFNPAGSQKNTLLIGAAALVLAAACAAAVPFAEDTATELLPGVEQFNAAYLAWDLAAADRRRFADWLRESVSPEAAAALEAMA